MIATALICFFLYGNTFWHSFTQDDAIVIYNNEFTKKGIQGISDIFSTDSFYGYFGSDQSNLVSGGRYRPLSIAFFAIVYEVAGLNPLVYHVTVVAMYAILCVLLFYLLTRFDISIDEQSKRWVAFVGVILFAMHPIHTEVVANVKGLDEIFSLLFAVISCLLAIRYCHSKAYLYLLAIFASFFCALLSKESAIVFVLLLPITLYYFVLGAKWRQLFLISITLIAAAGTYLIIRGNIIGWHFQATSTEMLNNPFIKLVDGKYLAFTTAEKWASIVLGLGKYIQLLFFPYPLTHDYYPRHFPVSQWSDMAVWMALLMNICLILIAILGIGKRSFLSFAICFFYIAIGLTSNILFPIGTHLSERFLFVASLPFCLLVAYGGWWFAQVSRMKTVALSFLLIVMALYSVQTVARNRVWKDDFNLFTSDVHISSGSAKVHNAAAGALIDKALTEADPLLKESMFREAKAHATSALTIHPAYKNAQLLLGNAHLYLKEYKEAVAAYNVMYLQNNTDKDVQNNLFIALKEGARFVGSKENNIPQAIDWLTKALQIKRDDAEAHSLMGIALGNNSRHAEALSFFEKAIELDPQNPRNFVNKGYAQSALGMAEAAQISFQQALRLNPNALNE